jgi:hypothetical protein
MGKIIEWLLSHLSFKALEWLVGTAWFGGVIAALLNLPATFYAWVQLAFLALIAALYYYLPKRWPVAQQVLTFPLVIKAFVPTVESSATYKSKLWLEFRNDASEALDIKGVDWKCSSDEVQLQPPFGYRLKVESTLGGWKNKSWNAETKEACVPSGGTFQIWIGINPSYKVYDLDQRHKDLRIGTLIFLTKVSTGFQNIEVQL